MHHSSPIAPRRRIRLWPLLILLALALFPFGWLGEAWPPFGMIINTLFATTQAHAVGHALIFALLGAGVLVTFPGLVQRPLLYFGLMLVASVGQEAFQLVYKQRALVLDDGRDIVVDLCAFTLVFGIAALWSRRSTHKHI